MNQIAVPPRQQIVYPTVAYVRKGKPKIKVEKNGRSYEQLAPRADLANKFRVHFLPGTIGAREAYHVRHAKELVNYPAPSTIPNGYEVKEIRAIVPAISIWSAWRYGNTANNAGREIARADDKRYWKKRDPIDGRYLVRDGEPYTPFTPGDMIEYDRDGKHYAIPLKPSGELRIVCADMIEAGQLVEFVLKTTSFYDCQQIQSQLAGIQAIADAVNGGNVAGVPLRIYRAEQEILWNHSDGTATRPKVWLINVQAEPLWVRAVFSKMGKMAISDNMAGLLPSPAPLVGTVDPLADVEDHSPDETDERDPGDWIDGDITEDGNAIPGGDWKDFLGLVKTATEKGVKLPEYKRENMTPDTVRGASEYIRGKLNVKKA